jgi:hypothetical protein
MTDELDPGLRRLFAETANTPEDDVFVAAVTSVTARKPRLLAGGGFGQALRSGAIAAAAAAAFGLVLSQVSGPVGALVNASPFGWIAGLALVLAGAAGVRVLAPFAGQKDL